MVSMDGKDEAMVVGRLGWLAVGLPTLAIGLFEFLRHQWLSHALPGWLAEGWAGNALGALVVGCVVFGFVRLFAGLLRRSAIEAMGAREEAAVALERQRVAREMHDNVAQTLFYLGANLREVGTLVESGEKDDAMAELGTVEAHLKEAHAQVRAVISDADRRDGGPEDLRESVRRTAAGISERLDMRVECRTEGRPSLPPPATDHVLAIVHEALTNAHRHGNASAAVVSVGPVEGGLSVEISDDGKGFEPADAPDEGSYGLAIMAERARMIGGELDLASVPGRGSRVTVRVPGDGP
jgi:signal transduction histidine kinase